MQLDRLIRDLVAVGLSLTLCASIVDEPAASSRLTQAVDGLDRVIRDLRRDGGDHRTG